jgi:hypothetical protein
VPFVDTILEPSTRDKPWTERAGREDYLSVSVSFTLAFVYIFFAYEAAAEEMIGKTAEVTEAFVILRSRGRRIGVYRGIGRHIARCRTIVITEGLNELLSKLVEVGC